MSGTAWLHHFSRTPLALVPELAPWRATTRDEIEQMIARGVSLEIIDEKALALPPEAEEEPEPAATAYLRLPPALKSRIEAAAAEDGISLNAWAIRCSRLAATATKQSGLRARLQAQISTWRARAAASGRIPDVPVASRGVPSRSARLRGSVWTIDYTDPVTGHTRSVSTGERESAGSAKSR
jgi:hypothetical protein